jgi:transcriptional regulator with XRE-family HTH domain
MAFATRLKWARDRAGVTQQQIADQCGISNRTISALEKGRAHDVLGDNLYCIADFLRVSPRWLIRGTGSPDDADSLSAEIGQLSTEQQEAIRRIIETMRR